MSGPGPVGAPFVRVWADGSVRHVQLNRPDRLNAVSEEVYADLEAALEDAGRAEDVRVLVLSGAGRAFCAGADLKTHAARERDAAARRAYVWAGQRVCRLLQRISQPVVVAVHGHAIGAGAELALAGDVIVCAEDARIALPEVSLGSFVGGGASRLLPLSVGLIRAKQLLLLGRELTGSEAVEWGLATESVPAEDLERRTAEVAGYLAQQPAHSLRLAKEALGRAGQCSLDEALVFEAEALLDCLGSDEWTDGVRRFVDDGSDPQAEAR